MAAEHTSRSEGRRGGRLGWLVAWWPALLWAGVVFVLSAIPGKTYPHVSFEFADKIVHLGIFAVLGALCGHGARRTFATRAVTGVIWATVLATAYGVLDEYHQLFTPFRSGGDLGDGIADAIGALLGAVAHASWLGLRGGAASRDAAPTMK